ncbi:MAG: Flp family type IVb pilin [bacterium]
MDLIRGEKGAGMTEYGLMIALITVVAIVGVWALSEGYLAFGRKSPDRAKQGDSTITHQMLLEGAPTCESEGQAKLRHRSPDTDGPSIHAVTWCSGTGDGSKEIGNSLNKLSVKYPEGTDPSGVRSDNVTVKLDKDQDGEFEKNASSDVSGVTSNNRNLVITLTGNYNVDKRDGITFVYSGVNNPNNDTDTPAHVTINGNAPDAGDETQNISF